MADGSDAILPRSDVEEYCRELREGWNETEEYRSGKYCEPFFDSLICWKATEADTEAVAPCVTAPHVGIYANGGNVTKYCNPDATWWIHPDSETNQSWANYSQCVMKEWGKALGVNDLFVAGYSISLVMILSALFIFFYFRSLHCTRITIHKNLFISFTFNNIAWILWYKLITDANWHYHHAGQSSTTAGCVTLHIVIHYFLLSNYMWMLCEGLYLHTLLVVAFVEERRIMRYLYLIGWLFPAVIITIFGVCRGLLQNEIQQEMCWTSATNYDYIYQIPVALSVILNFVFLVNIVRVLLLKIRLPAATAEEQERNRASRGHRKAVRALLILIPLLGIQHFLTPYIAEEDKAEHEQKNFVAYVCTQLVVIPLQGTWVALLFCFFNSEVLSLFKKKYRQYMLTKRGADPGLSQQLPLAATPRFADGHSTGTVMIRHETAEFNGGGGGGRSPPPPSPSPSPSPSPRDQGASGVRHVNRQQAAAGDGGKYSERGKKKPSFLPTTATAVAKNLRRSGAASPPSPLPAAAEKVGLLRSLRGRAGRRKRSSTTYATSQTTATEVCCWSNNATEPGAEAAAVVTDGGEPKWTEVSLVRNGGAEVHVTTVAVRGDGGEADDDEGSPPTALKRLLPPTANGRP